MMYHEKETSLKMLRKGSSDIDTLTMLPKQVATMVDIIATNNGVSPDWLNNRWFADNEYHEELEPYIVWKDSGFKFDHINLKIADLEGLFLLKARSVCDAIEFSGYPNDKGKLQNELRTQDVMDLISILRFFGESVLKICNISRGEPIFLAMTFWRNTFANQGFWTRDSSCRSRC